MVRKLARNWKTRQDAGEIGFPHPRHRVLIAPGTVLLLAYVLMFQFVGTVHAQSVTLAWDPNVEPVLGYKVYRSEQSGAFSPPSITSLMAATSYTDATVQPGHSYYYVVTATSTAGLESGYSSQVQVLIPVPNKAPTVNAGADQTITLPAPATLTATANDDGLPNGTLMYQWSIVSGSGVALSSTNTASTQATFTAAGRYTFRVTAYDGQLSSTDDVVVIVNATATTNNKAPTVNAGADQTITLPATTTLTATAGDDGLPNNTLTYQWNILSGSGVALSATNTASIKVTFTAAGTYTFRVTASDGELSASDDVIVVVNATATTNNKAPTVNAGADQTITLPATATLTATANDDDLPNGTLTYQWGILSGSGVALSATSTASIKATFSAAGNYTFRVTASDGQLSASDDVTVVVSTVATTNKAPTVNAGADQTILLPATATLMATANDDGLPNATLTYQWTLISGIGASLNNPTLSSVQVSFTGAGIYTFRVTVNDGQLTATDDITVVVVTATSNLTIAVSKNADTITGAITPVYIQTAGGQVQTLELLIDGQKQATTSGRSMTYRWKTYKVPTGTHTLKVNAYVGEVITATKTLTVTVR